MMGEGAALTSLLIKCNGLQRVGKRVRGHRINKWGGRRVIPLQVDNMYTGWWAGGLSAGGGVQVKQGERT